MQYPGDREAGVLIRGGRLIDPTQDLDQTGDILIRGGRIAAVGAQIAADGAEAVAAEGLVVCPGLVDMHVHFRTPGEERKEDIITGSAAAAAGGFTTVVCEPNTHPPLDSGVMVKQLLDRAKLESRVHLHAKGCMTLAQIGEEAAEYEEMRDYGAAAISNDGEPIEDEGLMAEIMSRCASARMVPTLHEEAGGKIPLSADSHRREPELVERDAKLAAQERTAVHFSHLSTAAAVEIVDRYKREGIGVTAEATPHHLALCAEEAPAGDGNFKMNPPLRPHADRLALQKAVAAGVIECIATDHAPHTPREKGAGFEAAPFGVIGLETALGVVLTTMYHPGLMSLPEIVRAMSTRPREVLRMARARLARGYRADLTLFDPEAHWVVDADKFHSKGRNTPFAGRELKGGPVSTIVAGRWVMRDRELTG